MKWVAGALLIVFGPILLLPLFIGLAVQPWSIFGMSRGVGGIILDPPGPGTPPIVIGPQPVVTDGTRYQLALAAGFSPAEAETATAVSIAENGGGNPAALSGRNDNGTYDLGLWQINTIWWAQFGGQVTLTDPLTNARAAHYVYTRQGWCAWSVYEAACGPGHTSAYRAYIARARAAAHA